MALTNGRFQPAAGPTAYKTFGIKAPISTHYRPATCAEMCDRADTLRREGLNDDATAADCGPHRNGWATTVMCGSGDEAFVRRVCAGEVDGLRRHFIEVPQPNGFVQLVFDAGQPCFRVGQHKLRVDRPELYIVRGGDWRAQTSPTHRYDRADQWVDDFACHQDRLKTEAERG